MTARQNFYNEALTETTTTSTSYGDQVALTCTPDSGAPYWLIASCQIVNITNATADVKARLFDDTAAASLRDVNYECKNVGSEYHTVFWVAQITGSGVSQTWSIEFAAESAGNTCKCKNAAIALVRMDSADQYAESLGDSTESAGSLVDKTTLTFTPGTSGDYLVIAAAEIRGTGTTQETHAQLLGEDGSTTYAAGTRGNKDGTNWYSWATAVKRTLAATSKTFKIQFKTQDAIGEVAHMRNACILAIRLDAFANAYYAESRSGTSTTSTSYQDKVTLTQTPAAGDHLLFAFGCLNIATTTNLVFGDFDQAGSELFDHVYAGASGRGGNIETMFGIRKVTLSAVSTTWKTRVKVDGGALNGTLSESGIAVIDLELAAGASGYPAARYSGRRQAGLAGVSIH